MILVATSLADPASENIRRQLLLQGDWEEAGSFEGRPVLRKGDRILLTLEESHLYRDYLDKAVEEALGEPPSLVIYASRHRSESGMRALTVHPIGNFGEARLGGKPGRLVPTAPHWMTQALRLLKEKSKGLDHAVSFEATHHGPYLETPTFYIEVGSDEQAWDEEKPARIIAEVILQVQPLESPVAIGIGGGHYVPRLTDVALGRRISFGHLIPSYAIDSLGEVPLSQAIEETPGSTLAYIHRKALKADSRSRLETLLQEQGLTVVRERELDYL